MFEGRHEFAHVLSARHLWYGGRRILAATELEFHWKVAKVIAASDGVLSDGERSALLGRMSSTVVPSGVIERVMTWDATGGLPPEILDYVMLSTSLRRDLGHAIVYDGLSVSFADGVLALAECGGARVVAEVMGVAPATFEQLVALCREEWWLQARRFELLRGPGGVEVSCAPSPLAQEVVPDTVRAEAARAQR